jgi:serine/threonine-protein kinase
MPLDGRTDLYALGVTAYLALTGELPFTGATASDVLSAHLHAPVEPLRRRRSGIPADADDLCLWLLAKSPGARPASAEVARTILRSLDSLKELT